MKIKIAIAATALFVLIYFIFFNNSTNAAGTHVGGKMKSNSYWNSQAPDAALTDFRELQGLVQDQGKPNKQALKDHIRLFFRYPSHSRPLDLNMVDILKPFAFESQKLPLTPEAKNDDTGAEYYFQYRTTRAAISGEQTFYATVGVYEYETNEPVEISIVEAATYSDPKFGRLALSGTSYSDDGKNGDRRAGDKQYTFRWKYESGNAWGENSMRIRLLAPGDSTVYMIDVSFFYTPKPPARFTGKFTEKIHDGSLRINAELEVTKPGHYIIEANLYANSQSGDEEEPTHWVYFNDELAAGLFDIPLEFYGLIFHEKSAKGPYRLGQLRGYRNNIGFSIKKMETIAEGGAPELGKKSEPHRELITEYGGEYKTKAYDLNVFTKKEYTGVDKKKKLAEVDSLTF